MTYLQLKNELLARLSITSANTFWTDTMIDEWINQANRWACNYKKWPFLEKAVYTQSVANALYYDYPEEFKTDSISRLEIDGEEYKKVRYDDFMKYIQDGGEDKIFSDFNRFYFINPKVAVSGKEITIWGQIKPPRLVNDNDETLFSDGEEAGDEAIVKRALMIALQKAKKYKEAAVERDETKLILEEVWGRIQEEQSRYQSKDNKLFNIPRFF